MLTTLALIAHLTAAAGMAAEPPPPDVLLISIDDLRADRVRPDLMPNLSRLSREAIRFTSAYSEATWTLPGHASLLTSLYPGSHGAGGNTSAPRTLMYGDNLAQILDKKGYSAASYTNCYYLSHLFGLAEGFLPRVDAPMYDDPVPDATQWFLRMPTPGFLFLHTYWVHDYINAIDPPRDASGAWRCPLDGGTWQRLPVESLSCKDLALSYDRAAYCADKVMGKLFDDLKAAGRWQSTLIVVTSDHGEALCDGPKEAPRRGHALLPYDEQTRVPLLVKLPQGRFAGRLIDSSAELIDVVPTVLDALRLPPPPDLQGTSLLPRLDAKAPRQKDAPIFYDADGSLGVRYEGWKFIRPAGAPAELYDLRSDPGETRSLVQRQPRRTAKFQALLREHFGRQTAGWRVAVRGRAGARFTLTARSNAPLDIF